MMMMMIRRPAIIGVINMANDSPTQVNKFVFFSEEENIKMEAVKVAARCLTRSPNLIDYNSLTFDGILFHFTSFDSPRSPLSSGV